MRMRKAVTGTLALLLAVGTISFNEVVYAKDRVTTTEAEQADTENEQTEIIENDTELSDNVEENTDITSDEERNETVENYPQENETKELPVSGDGWTLDESGVFTFFKDIKSLGGSYPYGWEPYAEQIKEVRVAEGVTEIPDAAFFKVKYKNLKKVTMSSTVKRIGDHAFYLNANLTEVILNDGLEYVGHTAFAWTGITSIRLPEGVTWGGDVFADCTNLRGTLVIPANSKWTGNAHFWNTGVTAVVIEEGVTELGVSSFMECENLQYVRVPKSLVKMGYFPIPSCNIIGYKGTIAEKYVEYCQGTGSPAWEGITFHAIDGDEHTGEWKTITEPTCTENGIRELICTIPLCGEKKTEVLAATGHKWDDGKVTQAATEKAEGIKTHTCSLCGESRIEAIAKLASSGSGNTNNQNISPSHSVNTPKTGTAANIYPWTVSMTASAGVATVFLMKKRKYR